MTHQIVIACFVAGLLFASAGQTETRDPEGDIYVYVNYAYKETMPGYDEFPMYQLILFEFSNDVSADEKDFGGGRITKDHDYSSYIDICSDEENICFESALLSVSVPKELQSGKPMDWAQAGSKYSTSGELEELKILGKTVDYIVIKGEETRGGESQYEFLYSQTNGLIGIRRISQRLMISDLYLLSGKCGFGSDASCNDDYVSSPVQDTLSE